MHKTPLNLRNCAIYSSQLSNSTENFFQLLKIVHKIIPSINIFVSWLLVKWTRQQKMSNQVKFVRLYSDVHGTFWVINKKIKFYLNE